jgi:aspartyl-tRNA(Asn)/glutamyl-tRNA(Gln) amidotransferase subunit B
MVIGLEVHAQLNTRTKIFAADETAYGAAPNSQVSPITLGLPGVLPKFNGAVLEKAIRLGLACNCTISEESHFARKNYFYADLPKGYQISQDKKPVCTGGYIEVQMNGEPKKIALTRIHMEEDAGKNNHELDPEYSLIDLNRAGVPLLEIVSEPDIRSAEEAHTYLTEIRKLVRYLGICDGNMEEGSLRCDANISIRRKGETHYNTRVEVKNMNSIRNVKRAIENEVKRQIELVESGGTVEQETRSFNQADGSSFPLRSKEHAHDYRYFPEPDLPPVLVTQSMIERVKQSMPPLPKELYDTFTSAYQLSSYNARVITDDPALADYFLRLIRHTGNYKAAANWVMGEVKSAMNENEQQPLPEPAALAGIISLTDANKINSSAAKIIFSELMNGSSNTALEIAQQRNLLQSSDSNELATWAKQALEQFPDKVAEYKKGKTGNINLFMGSVMKLSKGKADPKLATKILEDLLKN